MHSRGFTLVEMLVVMTISAILIAAAVPSFQWMIARNRVSDATNLLMSNLEFARLEAARRGNIVAICRTLDPTLDPPVCSSVATGTVDGNDWAVGWVVFVKSDGNIDTTNFETAPSDRVIFRQQAFNTGGARVMIHSNIPTAERVAYSPRGTGGFSGSGTFAIGYGQPFTPTVATRSIGALSLDGAARCLPMTVMGSLRVTRPSAGVCPP